MNQTEELSKFANRQFAIIMLRNAKISANTVNTVTFQLATNKNNQTVNPRSTELSLKNEEAAALESELVECMKMDKNPTIGKILKKLE